MAVAAAADVVAAEQNEEHAENPAVVAVVLARLADAAVEVPQQLEQIARKVQRTDQRQRPLPVEQDVLSAKRLQEPRADC